MPQNQTSLAQERVLRRRIQIWLALFIAGLIISGLTAFPLQTELDYLTRFLGLSPADVPANFTGLRHWLLTVREGLHETNAKYPFIAYGTDWLAFSHIVIAIFFLGPLFQPEHNRWVIASGLIACGLVIVLALIAGPLRGIPPAWRLVDCSFGVVGAIPLWLAWRDSSALAELLPPAPVGK